MVAYFDLASLAIGAPSPRFGVRAPRTDGDVASHSTQVEKVLWTGSASGSIRLSIAGTRSLYALMWMDGSIGQLKLQRQHSYCKHVSG